MLVEDTSYKVRVQAALVLGKLRDKAATPALAKALSDENKTVRAMAAQALGQLCEPTAKGSLDGLAARETDGFVKAQVVKALAALRTCAASGSDGGKKKIYLHLGPFTGGVKSAGPESSKMVHDYLGTEVGRLPSVALTLPAGVDERSFSRSGLQGFLIDGNITRFDETLAAGPSAEISCDVRVMLARWPSQSILLWTSAGATVPTGSRPQDKTNARRECFEEVAKQLGEDLVKFLKSQGG